MIEECRPISKEKHWRVTQILERHEVAEVQPRQIDAVLTGSAPRGLPTEPADVTEEAPA